MSDPTSPDDPTGVPADSQPPAAPQPETAAAAPAAPAAPAEAAAPSAPPAPAAPTAYPAPDAYGAPAAGYPGGAPQAPYGAPQAPYGAAPTAYATPGEPYPGGPAAPPTAPGARPKVLAIVALALAAVGLIMSFIPVVTWFSGIFLLAGFIVGLVALISKKQGGKGLSIAALAISVVGWIVSIVVTIASIAAFSQAAQDALDESRSSSVSGSEATDEEPAAEEPAGDAQAVEVVETGFGRESFGDSWWYVVILDNPNADYVYDFAEIGVEALSADGTILDSSPQYVTLLSGQTALSGSFLSVGQGEVASIEVRVPEAGEAIASAADETGSFTIEGVTGTSDDYSTTVTGTVSGMFQEDQEFVAVTVVARSADGAIINGTVAYVDRLPADGGKVQFEAMFFDPLPADTTYEASAHL